MFQKISFYTSETFSVQLNTQRLNADIMTAMAILIHGHMFVFKF